MIAPRAHAAVLHGSPCSSTGAGRLQLRRWLAGYCDLRPPLTTTHLMRRCRRAPEEHARQRVGSSISSHLLAGRIGPGLASACPSRPSHAGLAVRRGMSACRQSRQKTHPKRCLHARGHAHQNGRNASRNATPCEVCTATRRVAHSRMMTTTTMTGLIDRSLISSKTWHGAVRCSGPQSS